MPKKKAKSKSKKVKKPKARGTPIGPGIPMAAAHGEHPSHEKHPTDRLLKLPHLAYRLIFWQFINVPTISRDSKLGNYELNNQFYFVAVLVPHVHRHGFDHPYSDEEKDHLRGQMVLTLTAEDGWGTCVRFDHEPVQERPPFEFLRQALGQLDNSPVPDV